MKHTLPAVAQVHPGGCIGHVLRSAVTAIPRSDGLLYAVSQNGSCLSREHNFDVAQLKGCYDHRPLLCHLPIARMVELHCAMRSSNARWVVQELQGSGYILINHRLPELWFQVDQCL